MEPTKIIAVSKVQTLTGKSYLWRCDDNNEYLTRHMAEIIGTSPEGLVSKYRIHGLDNSKLFKKSKQYFKKKVDRRMVTIAQKSKWSCNVGDMVLVNGKVVQVAQVLCQCNKREKEKVSVTVVRIMGNGQVLNRSPLYVGQQWYHEQIQESC